MDQSSSLCRCPRCGSTATVKNGSVKGAPKHKCKACGFQFTKAQWHGATPHVKLVGVLLYAHGLSMNAIGKLLGFSTPAVLYWIKHYARNHLPQTRSGPGGAGRGGRNVALPRKKTQKCWIWKAYCRTTGRLVDWECGGRDHATFQRLFARLKRWGVRTYYTDHWEVYAETIPPENLVQSKRETVAIERNNGRQRHWLARFRRRSIVVSKTLEMVNASLALLAAYHVNHTVNLPLITTS